MGLLDRRLNRGGIKEGMVKESFYGIRDPFVCAIDENRDR